MLQHNTLYKIGAILLAVASPLICILFAGFNESLSDYWTTDMQPLFIFTNAVTSYYLFTNPKWRIPSSLLLLLTAFSVEEFKIIHNSLAIAFFITALIAMLLDKRYKLYAIPYISSIFWFRSMDEMLIAEMIAIYVLCAFHATDIGHYLWLTWKRKQYKHELDSNF